MDLQDVLSVLDFMKAEFLGDTKLMDADAADKLFGWVGPRLYGKKQQNRDGLSFYRGLDIENGTVFADWVGEIVELPGPVVHEVLESATDFQFGLNLEGMTKVFPSAKNAALILFRTFYDKNHNLLSIWPDHTDKSDLSDEIRFGIGNAIVAHATEMAR